MKLFMVMYVYGQLVGSLGPIPEDNYAECKIAAANYWRNLDLEALRQQGIDKAAVRYACEYFNHQPDLP